MKESCVCFGGEGGAGWGRKFHEWVVYIACFPAKGRACLELRTMNNTDPGEGWGRGKQENLMKARVNQPPWLHQFAVLSIGWAGWFAIFHSPIYLMVTNILRQIIFFGC